MTSDAELAALVAASYSQAPDVNAGHDARAKFVTSGTEFVVLIPGTATALGAMRDLEVWPTWDKTLGPCHAGFLADGRALWSAVLPHIPRGRAIVFAGHSLGGAEAQILAALHGGPCRVVTFGSPRIALDFNLLFRPLVRRAAPQLTLYARPDDPVPHVPPAPFYLHAKRNTSIGAAVPGSDNEFPVDPVNDVNHGIKLYVADLQRLNKKESLLCPTP